MSAIKRTFTGYSPYRGQEGQAAFLLHRLTGLATILFLAPHIIDTAALYFAPAFYLRAIELYRTPGFALIQLVLVFCVIYHGLNGLRLVLADLFFAKQMWNIPNQRRSFYIVLAFAVILWIPVAIRMAQNLLNYMASNGQ